MIYHHLVGRIVGSEPKAPDKPAPSMEFGGHYLRQTEPRGNKMLLDPKPTPIQAIALVLMLVAIFGLVAVIIAIHFGLL